MAMKFRNGPTYSYSIDDLGGRRRHDVKPLPANFDTQKEMIDAFSLSKSARTADTNCYCDPEYRGMNQELAVSLRSPRLVCRRGRWSGDSILPLEVVKLAKEQLAPEHYCESCFSDVL